MKKALTNILINRRMQCNQSLLCSTQKISRLISNSLYLSTHIFFAIFSQLPFQRAAIVRHFLLLHSLISTQNMVSSAKRNCIESVQRLLFLKASVHLKLLSAFVCYDLYFRHAIRLSLRFNEFIM